MTEHVLITGGAGFIGSHLARRFHEAGHRVTILDAFIPQVHGGPEACLAHQRFLEGFANVVRGSVASADDLRHALRGTTAVVHLAAETGTAQSMYEVDRYVSTNVGGTAKLLDLIGDGGHAVRRVVVASSRAIYGEGAYVTARGKVVYPPHRSERDLAAGRFEVVVPGEGPLTLIPTAENARIQPASVYGITKQAQESLVMTVAPARDVEAVALRYQNVYGPGQSLKNPYTGILSIFSTLIRQGKEINIFEDGRESRDFIFIDDVVEATYLAVVEPAAAGSVFNVGSGVPIAVTDVVTGLMDAFGVEVPTRISGSYRVGDIRHNVADTRRIRDVLGFEASVDFAQGVAAFAEWVQNEPAPDDSYERSLEELTKRRLLK
ncbi:NAD-dependent epimerase/dehydratase family protein [Microbacterium sp. PRC9]|uniref:NAD-dependent epimerase/dehydratase family protein n=1 Tax=Microbacterium sp. PRC9 TaxID=2962591 RepID=UPI00288128BA|nr:NAD-dependent epimerase/dehydratase family protein [Microbacterium sp. PRC9]MDT0141086.1 NAD-dependent epimerase/dehydratase family protein [Microbacterium sp. PRC9]